MSGFGYMGDYRSGFDPGGNTERRCDAGVLWAEGGVGDGEGGVKRGQERVRCCSGGCFVALRASRNDGVRREGGARCREVNHPEPFLAKRPNPPQEGNGGE
ncbi:MAG TPA: hypothetical protein DCW95_02430 [Chryseobacterium sp.]|nr:hypothetical protein [Chryseobacterium sp.]